MKAWVIDSLGGLGALRLAEVEGVRAGKGEVVLGMRLAGLNPADRYLAEGMYPARPMFPHVLGRDGLGVVVEIGEGVTGMKVGETKLILRTDVGVDRWGTFAEKCAVGAESLTDVPEGWSEEEAAGAPLVYVTGYQALTQWGELERGSVVLVTGASGGVGVATVQLAKAMGCVVIGMSRSAEKGKRVRELGADLVVNPEDTQWRRDVKGFCEKVGRKVDLAVDNVGGSVFGEMMDVMGMWGRISCVGRLAGPVPMFNTAGLFFRRLRIGGVAIGTYTVAETQGAWRDVLELMGRTGARPVVDEVFGFGELVAAFEKLGRGPMGKVLVRVGEG